MAGEPISRGCTLLSLTLVEQSLRQSPERKRKKPQQQIPQQNHSALRGRLEEQAEPRPCSRCSTLRFLGQGDWSKSPNRTSNSSPSRQAWTSLRGTEPLRSLKPKSELPWFPLCSGGLHSSPDQTCTLLFSKDSRFPFPQLATYCLVQVCSCREAAGTGEGSGV